MSTIDKKPVAVNFNNLAEEWGKPKSLLEIYQLVGRFPFKAKAVVPSSEGSGHMVSIGEIVDLIGPGKHAGMGGFVTSWRPPGDVRINVYFVINSSIRRWLLVED